MECIQLNLNPCMHINITGVKSRVETEVEVHLRESYEARRAMEPVDLIKRVGFLFKILWIYIFFILPNLESVV